jgi:hypothetical protein
MSKALIFSWESDLRAKTQKFSFVSLLTDEFVVDEPRKLPGNRHDCRKTLLKNYVKFLFLDL